MFIFLLRENFPLFWYWTNLSASNALVKFFLNFAHVCAFVMCSSYLVKKIVFLDIVWNYMFILNFVHHTTLLMYHLGLVIGLIEHGAMSTLLWWISISYLYLIFRLLASGSDDFNIIIWDAHKRKPKQTLQSGHEGNIFTVKVRFC